jgi:hypothetical protein
MGDLKIRHIYLELSVGAKPHHTVIHPFLVPKYL